MKKLILFTLLAMPQAYGIFRQTQPETTQERGPFAGLGQQVFKNLYDKVTEQYPELKDSLNKISEGDLSRLYEFAQKALSTSLEKAKPALQNLKYADKTLTVAEVNGLLNKLKAYGVSSPNRPVLSGIRLNPALEPIFDEVKETYKKLIEENKPELANNFLQTLVYSIVTGTTPETLAPAQTAQQPIQPNEPQKSSTLIDALGKLLGL